MNTTSGFDVREYGAVGDGLALDHESIQRAIDACAAAGGGQVYVPPGRFRCGTLRMRSNVCLFLDMGARILAADDPALYPEICKTPFGNLPGQIQALLWADGVENVTVAGFGAIDGGADSPLSPEEAAGILFRPALVFYRDCRNVRFLDVTLENSTFWTLHLLRCRNVLIRGCTIVAHLDRINADGIDPDGCEDVIISDCRISTGDDCIVVKSTEGDLCRNITVSNCLLRSSQTALKIGTEAMGDIRNVTFSNCTVSDSKVALAVFMKDGSTYENIIFSNIMAEASHDFPVIVDHTPRYHKEPRVGVVRNILFDNIFIRSNGRCYLEGAVGAPLESIVLRNVSWTADGPARVKGAKKAPGARRIDPDPAAPDYAGREGHLVAVRVRGLIVEGFRLLHEKGAPRREPVFAHELLESPSPRIETLAL
jgi:hypothetical protein